jgi:CheY-like chemotaxis protein
VRAPCGTRRAVAAVVIDQQPAPQSTRPLDVLLVEDDEATSELMAMAVRSFGHHCRVVHDGAHALEAIAEERPDVVVSDFEMPGMNGVDLCRRVRADASDISRIYFILLSGYDDPAHVDAGTAAGADDYQRKPIDLDRLEASLHAASTVWWRATC